MKGGDYPWQIYSVHCCPRITPHRMCRTSWAGNYSGVLAVAAPSPLAARLAPAVYSGASRGNNAAGGPCVCEKMIRCARRGHPCPCRAATGQPHILPKPQGRTTCGPDVSGAQAWSCRGARSGHCASGDCLCNTDGRPVPGVLVMMERLLRGENISRIHHPGDQSVYCQD